MDGEALRELCRAFPGAEETHPFRAEFACFKVAGKVFALSALRERPLRVSMKCDPGLAEQLREAHPEIVGGYHLNKRHWNTVSLEGALPDTMIGELVEDSYDLVVSGLPQVRQRALGWSPGRTGH